MKRRGFFLGTAVTLVAAPAIVRADALMQWSVLDPLMVNPPDFWMRPDHSELVPRWRAGWWQTDGYDIAYGYPIGDRFEDINPARVPRLVRDNGKDITIVRRPDPAPVKPDWQRPTERLQAGYRFREVAH